MPFILLVASARSSPSSSVTFCVFISSAATQKETDVAAITERITPTNDALGVISKIAKIEPGDAGDTMPASKTVRVNTPAIPPAITARIRRGFIKMYGK